jgi:ATP-binding cassette subfamily B protein
VNLLFTTVIGVIFVMIYAALTCTGPSDRPTCSPSRCSAGSVPCSAARSRTVQKVIVKETTALAGSTTESLRNIELVKSLGLAQQEIDRLNSTTAKILKLELKKGPLPAQPELHPGHFRQHSADLDPVPDALPDLHAAHHRRQFFSLFIYSFFIFGPLQELGNVVNTYRETEASLQKFETILAMEAGTDVRSIRSPSVGSKP